VPCTRLSSDSRGLSPSPLGGKKRRSSLCGWGAATAQY
jgi:hypothetical protein